MTKSQQMRIFMYHGVTRACADSFQKQLRDLSTRYRIVPLSAIVQNASHRVSCADAAITFDDGLENNYTVVYPVLQKLNLPATFFVCPGLIEKRKWSWNCEARARLAAMERADRRAIARELSIRNSQIEGIVEWMKAAPLASRNFAENRIRHASSAFVPTPEQHEQFDPLTWEQLSNMDPHLISIGSHSLSHSILSTMMDAEIEFDARESRRLLENRLGCLVEFFCYPNGSYDHRVVGIIQRHYRAAVCTVAGTVKLGADLYTLPRIPREGSAKYGLRIYQWFRQLHHDSGLRVPAGNVD
jgi:peptidoglycan/xylan/chitin deacetylase (PgdA/CDA1 family)